MMRIRIVLLCTCLWMLAIVSGLCYMANYDATPGTVAVNPSVWPAGTSITRDSQKFTLIMAAHPRCPCTRVSIDELAKILERTSTGVNVQILFFKPRGADWAPTGIWRQAAAIPGASTVWDEDGVEAARFGAHTSGHTLLFDHHGTLLFSGGLTRSRGHAGPSIGNRAVASWLTPNETGAGTSLVFGCALNDLQSPCTEGNKACPNCQ